MISVKISDFDALKIDNCDIDFLTKLDLRKCISLKKIIIIILKFGKKFIHMICVALDFNSILIFVLLITNINSL